MFRRVTARTTVLFTVLLLFVLLPAAKGFAVSATLTATPNPLTFVSGNDSVTFTGCGYDPAAGGVQINVDTPEAFTFQGGPTDAAGCLGADGQGLTFTGFVVDPATTAVDPDVYTARAYQHLHGPANHLTLVAETTFTVVTA